MAAAVQSETAFARKPTLTAVEVEDLTWFFDGAEGSFGVRSNFGAMEDELVRRSLSDEARIELQKEARRKTAAKRYKTPVLKECESGLAALYAAAGLSMPPTPTPPPDEDLVPEWAQQYIHVGAEHAASDPEINIDLKLARRATHTRNRLVKVGTSWTGVLFAAYGPASAKWKQEAHGNPAHPITKMDNPALGDICMALLAFERSPDDPPPYDMFHARCATTLGMLELRNKALQLLWDANNAYLQTRCPLPPHVHKTRMKWKMEGKACMRCWPQ